MTPRRLLTLLLAICVIAPVTSAAAQEDEQQLVSWIFYVRADRGMEQQFEAALAAHAAWHADNSPDEYYGVGQVMTGDRAGEYVIVLGSRGWSDLDGFDSEAGQADLNQWNNTAGMLSTQTASIISTNMPKLSRPGEDAFSVVQVTRFRVRSGMEEQFTGAIAKFHEALDGAPTRYTWGAVVAGADAPSFTLATYHDSFADLAPDPAMRAHLAEKMTPEGVEAAAQAFAECVETQQANIILVRPDLSYQPAE